MKGRLCAVCSNAIDVGKEPAPAPPSPPAKPLPAWAAEILAEQPPLLSREEAAEVSRISRKTLDRRIKDGTLAVVKNERRVLIPTRSLLEFLAAGVES